MGITFVMTKKINMRENSVNVQVRMPESIVKQLDDCKWAKGRSDAIRIILEAFFSMTPEEQTDFLRSSAVKKFSPKLL